MVTKPAAMAGQEAVSFNGWVSHAEVLDRLRQLSGLYDLQPSRSRYADDRPWNIADLIRNNSTTLGESGMWALHNWLRDHPETLTMLYAPLADGTWHSLILAFFVSAVVMPHMYHMAFTENLNPRALLTASGGALVMGLVFGWLRSTRPTYGRIPEAALWVFDNVGLAAFIGAVGITAGPGFVAGVRETGLGLVGAGLVAAVLPHAIGLAVGRFVLRMDPVILLGACAGAGTTTAGLKAIQDAADSKVPVLGYTVPYALGNVLLTAWGPVIVALMR